MQRKTLTLRQAALALTPRSVLLVDEDAGERAFIAGLLRDDGYAVSEVDTGEQALSRIARPRDAAGGSAMPDVIVADPAVGGQAGLAALARLRAVGVTVPVILVGDVDDEEAFGIAERVGAAAVLHRPLDPDDFRTAVLYYAAR